MAIWYWIKMTQAISDSNSTSFNET